MLQASQAADGSKGVAVRVGMLCHLECLHVTNKHVVSHIVLDSHTAMSRCCL